MVINYPGGAVLGLAKERPFSWEAIQAQANRDCRSPCGLTGGVPTHRAARVIELGEASVRGRLFYIYLGLL